MKCLICSAPFDNDEDLIEHYVSYHKIDPKNRLFQKLFQSSKNCWIFRKCYLKLGFFFLTTSDHKKKETVNKHGEYYDFESSEEVVDGFL